jgi:hypothetical protein
MIDISRGLPLTPFGFGVADSLAHVLYGAAGNQAGAEASVVLGLLSALLSLGGLVAWLRPLRAEPRPANTFPSPDTPSCA